MVGIPQGVYRVVYASLVYIPWCICLPTLSWYIPLLPTPVGTPTLPTLGTPLSCTVLSPAVYTTFNTFSSGAVQGDLFPGEREASLP